MIEQRHAHAQHGEPATKDRCQGLSDEVRYPGDGNEERGHDAKIVFGSWPGIPGTLGPRADALLGSSANRAQPRGDLGVYPCARGVADAPVPWFTRRLDRAKTGSLFSG